MFDRKCLDGKIAIVTGGGSGIGRGTAIILARYGAKVVVANNKNISAGNETVDIIKDEGGYALFFRCDVSKYQEINLLIKETEKAYGGIDIMFANAGITKYFNLEDMEVSDIDDILNINLRGALLCAKLSIPALKKRKGGSILFCSSVLSTIGFPGCVAYSATKAGLIGAARTLANELGEFNIRVNVVSPGTINTPMLENDFSGMNTEQADDFREKVCRGNSLLRIGEPEEIGETVAWLCSDSASYITGQNIFVDGGFTAVKRWA